LLSDTSVTVCDERVNTGPVHSVKAFSCSANAVAEVPGCGQTLECVISGASSGEICKWDLRAGKIISELSDAGDSVLSVWADKRCFLAGTMSGGLITKHVSFTQPRSLVLPTHSSASTQLQGLCMMR
jgi:hypothetical protein